MAGAEAFGDDIARVRCGNVVDLDVADALVGQHPGEDIRRVFGVAVDGGIGNHNGGLLGLIRRPMDVFVQEPRDILPPDRAVQRADGLNFNGGRLFKQRLHLRTVFADDVGVIPPCVGQILRLEVDLVGIEVAVQRAEGAKGIGGEERFGRCVVADHGLWPVNDRRHDEGEGMPSCAERVHLLDDHSAAVDVEGEKIPDHRDGLGVADDLDLRVAQHQILQNGAVIRLHVIDDHIIELPAIQNVRNVLEKQIGDGAVHGIEQNGLFIQQQIGVVAHAVRDGVNVLKKGESAVASADPVEIVRHFLDTVHGVPPN